MLILAFNVVAARYFLHPGGMAEQTSHDVVNQTRSGRDPSPSDVPADTTDKTTGEGGAGGTTDNETKTQGNSSIVGKNTDGDKDGALEGEKRAGGTSEVSSAAGFYSGQPVMTGADRS